VTSRLGVQRRLAPSPPKPRTSEKAGGAGSHESTWRSKRAGTVTLCSQAKSSSFWILLLLVCHQRKALSGDTLIINFSIVVSALNNYRYRIVQYAQPITQYPGTLTWYGKGLGYQVANEDQFSQLLRQILSSQETQSVVAGLIAQATEAAPPSA
jgi:hypothetical protein